MSAEDCVRTGYQIYYHDKYTGLSGIDTYIYMLKSDAESAMRNIDKELIDDELKHQQWMKDKYGENDLENDTIENIRQRFVAIREVKIIE